MSTGKAREIAAQRLFFHSVPLTFCFSQPENHETSFAISALTYIYSLLPGLAAHRTQKILFSPNPKQPCADWQELSLFQTAPAVFLTYADTVSL